MKHEQKEYLSEIFLPTPSGAEKLLAAWDELDTETKIQFLHDIEKLRYPSYLAEKIYKTALSSSNAYIRYLAAKSLYLDDENAEHKEIKAKIEADSSPLVKYSLLESCAVGAIFDKELENADKFFALPHEARLAKVRTLEGHGEKIANLLENVPALIKAKKVSELEVFEILKDYLGGQGFAKKYKGEQRLSYDGYAEYSKGKDIDSLWKVIPKLPEELTYPLLEALPESSGLSNVEDELLDSLKDNQLRTVLYRDDIFLEKYRKKILLDPKRQKIRDAAACRHFDLTYGEFAALIPNYDKSMIKEAGLSWKFIDKKDREKYEILKDLSHAINLSWVYYRAIHDLFCAIPSSGFGSSYEGAEYPKFRLDQLLEEAKSNRGNYHVERQATELKLYQLAVWVVPWETDKDGLSPHDIFGADGNLKFLRDAIVHGDTWKTFMGFSEAWDGRGNSKRLEKFLPTIDDFDDEERDSFDEESETAEEPEEKLSSIIKSIEDFREAADDTFRENNSILFENINNLSQNLHGFYDSVSRQAKTYDSLDNRMQTLGNSFTRQKYLLYILIAIVLFQFLTN